MLVIAQCTLLLLLTLHQPLATGDGTKEVNMERTYSTTVVIPTNLKDGVYVLQLWSTGTGAALPHSFSCTDLEITGGDDSITCPPMEMPPANDTKHGLDRCWSCQETHPHHAGCKPPHQVEGGFGFKFGKFCFPGKRAVPTHTHTQSACTHGDRCMLSFVPWHRNTGTEAGAKNSHWLCHPRGVR